MHVSCAAGELPQNELTLNAAVPAHSSTWRAPEALALLAKCGKSDGVHAARRGAESAEGALVASDAAAASVTAHVT